MTKTLSYYLPLMEKNSLKNLDPCLFPYVVRMTKCQFNKVDICNWDGLKDEVRVLYISDMVEALKLLNPLFRQDKSDLILYLKLLADKAGKLSYSLETGKDVPISMDPLPPGS